MFYELRRYQIQPGRRAEWVQYMEEVILPYQISKGMVVAGSFTDEEDPDGYVWIRRFEDEEQRQRLYAATYEADQWKNEISLVAKEMMVTEATQVTRIVPTPASGLR